MSTFISLIEYVFKMYQMHFFLYEMNISVILKVIILVLMMSYAGEESQSS